MDESKSEESFDSSDEDIYTNAVAKLKALKRKEKLRSRKIEEASFISDDVALVEITDDEKTEKAKETNWDPVILENVDEGIKSGVSEDNLSASSGKSRGMDLQVTSVTEIKSIAQIHDTGSIVLDPDDNEDLLMETDTSKNDLLEYENYNIEVKILWQSYKLVRLDMRMHETFLKAFEYFANLENIPVEQILLLRKDKPIKMTDTPASLGISVIDIIEGGVMDTEYVGDQGKGADDSNENICKIKVQTSQKESIMVSLQKSQPFKFIILQCATQLKIPESKLKLYFDGDLISPSDTPESLDFEDEACVDLKLTP